jgi:sec-independent protein translocase protein TatA
MEKFMIELFFKPTILFIFSSPQEWILVIAAVSLLFGANKLPELAKSIGKTRKAFKEGMREADEEDQTTVQKSVSPVTKPILNEIDDETLLQEINRRKTSQLGN